MLRRNTWVREEKHNGRWVSVHVSFGTQELNSAYGRPVKGESRNTRFVRTPKKGR